MLKSSLIVFASVLAFSNAVQQEITIYFEPNQGGESLVLRNKLPDLEVLKDFLIQGSSYCVTGYWKFFNDTNYLGGYAGLYGKDDAGERVTCANLEFGHFNSARYYGPSDTRTVALSVWEGSSDTYFGGVELVIEGSEQTNFNLNTTSFVASYGHSNWTLFTEPNFQGSSWCFQADENIYQQLDLNGTVVRSVRRDCN